MKRPLVVLAIAAALTLAVPQPAGACGASLFGLGQSVRFRSYRAPRPANILVYHDETLRAHSGGNASRFEALLERAGHDVTVVESDADLDRALSGTPFDVLIADFDAMQPLVVVQSSSSRGHPSLLPIVHDNKDVSMANEEGYSRVLGPDSDLRHVLRSINDLMKLRLK
jgi:hypothetical protein